MGPQDEEFPMGAVEWQYGVKESGVKAVFRLSWVAW